MWLYNPNGFFKRKIRELEVWEQMQSRGREGRGRILSTFRGGRGGPHGQDSGVAAPQVLLLGKCKPRKGRWGRERC